MIQQSDFNPNRLYFGYTSARCAASYASQQYTHTQFFRSFRHGISSKTHVNYLDIQYKVQKVSPLCRTGSSLQSSLQDTTSSSVGSKNICVFVSGTGSNFRRIYEQCQNGYITGTVKAVVSDKPFCKAVQFAQSQGIPTYVYTSGKPPKDIDVLNENELVTLLRDQLQIDLICLAGYLKLVPPSLVRAYPRAMLNIHPALLPSFGGKGMYGQHVHAAVIKSGARWSGPSVQFVSEQYDAGPIVAQRIVPVLPYDTVDTLSSRVLEQEHIVYSDVISAWCDDRVIWRDDGVPILLQPI